ncbi:MAG TPA: zinc-ribbon domain-containing protein, partial [Thermodesulfovibrionales bacterium]|nr:zinc-ribbon domain-containing protein [Thermodesulfovibrionales bacterium]
MVVICPKCKVRLKVGDEKIAPEGTRFKCPKCSTVLLVKRPVAGVRLLDKSKVLVAHEDAGVVETLKRVLTASGYQVLSARDGIEAMVTATKALPFAAVLG